jgi:alanyl-tRNA synthetase
MQYNQLEGGKREDLPKPSIDTGMGLERISAILQGKHDNYDTDLLRRLIEHSADLTNTGVELNSHRVIADHLRSSAFLIADGVLPSNEGRGYVLRRIMRRAMRHVHILGAKDPTMYKIFPTLLDLMGSAYPELSAAGDLITDTLKNEEVRFKATLDRGLKLLEDEKSKLSSGQALPGDVAFKLYDTYGFPVDLTQDVLKADGIAIDVDGFNESMEAQKKAARAAWSGSGDQGTEALWFDLLEKHNTTEFLGYKNTEAQGHVLAIIKDGAVVDSIKEGETGAVLTNQTPFYAESGGQMGDTGTMKSDDCSLTVTDTKKQLGKLHVHQVRCEKGTLKTADTVDLIVSEEARNATCANHSVTHLLHAALRSELGAHISQKGSLQDAERTRFDISHPKALTAEEISTIETLVNTEIHNNTPVTTQIMDIDSARETGAMALFGEKYDDEVRVVVMGSKDENEKAFSIELCGGTHVKQTGEIGIFKIISESALAAGVRRVEALTGQRALDYMNRQERTLSKVKTLLKTSEADLLTRLETLLQEKKTLEGQITDLRKQLATGGDNDQAAAFDTIEGIKFSGKVLAGIPPKDLKPMADSLKDKIESGVIVLIATSEDKASIVVGVTSDLTGKISAVDLVREGSKALGGKGGGGRPDMAQAGGPNPSSANDAIDAIKHLLKSA